MSRNLQTIKRQSLTCESMPLSEYKSRSALFHRIKRILGSQNSKNRNRPIVCGTSNSAETKVSTRRLSEHSTGPPVSSTFANPMSESEIQSSSVARKEKATKEETKQPTARLQRPPLAPEIKKHLRANKKANLRKEPKSEKSTSPDTANSPNTSNRDEQIAKDAEIKTSLSKQDSGRRSVHSDRKKDEPQPIDVDPSNGNVTANENEADDNESQHPTEQELRNDEIEQLRTEERELNEQLAECTRQMVSLQATLHQMDQREREQHEEKQQEALQFEREFRSRVDALQVRRDEAERELQLCSDRLNELKRRVAECTKQRKMAKQLLGELRRCLGQLSSQYENGCAQHRAELEQLVLRSDERRKRDATLMESYTRRQEELRTTLRQRALVRRTLEEHAQLQDVIGTRGIQMLVNLPNQQDTRKH